MFRWLLKLFALSQERPNPYASPAPLSVNERHVDLYVTQAELDNGEMVVLDVPEAGRLKLRLAPFMKEGYSLRMRGALPDGGNVIARVHVVQK
jgi:hypothetical protein